MTEFSAGRRVAAYVKLLETWSDKTGPVFPDGSSPNKGMHDKDYKSLTVKEKILKNVAEILEEHASMQTDAAQKKKDKMVEEDRQEAGMNELLSSAVAYIENKMENEANVAALPIGDAIAPFAKNEGTKKLKTTKWSPYKVAADAMDLVTKKDAILSEEKQRFQIMRLDLETKRHDEMVKAKQLQLEMQKDQAEFQKEQARKDNEFRVFQVEQASKDKEHQMNMMLEMQKGQADMMRIFFDNLKK